MKIRFRFDLPDFTTNDLTVSYTGHIFYFEGVLDFTPRPFLTSDDIRDELERALLNALKRHILPQVNASDLDSARVACDNETRKLEQAALSADVPDAPYEPIWDAPYDDDDDTNERSLGLYDRLNDDYMESGPDYLTKQILAELSY